MRLPQCICCYDLRELVANVPSHSESFASIDSQDNSDIRKITRIKQKEVLIKSAQKRPAKIHKTRSFSKTANILKNSFLFFYEVHAEIYEEQFE